MKFDEAIVNYQKALQINPEFAKAYNGLGHVFHEKGQLDEAEAYYRRAIQIDPENLHSYEGLLFQMLYTSKYDSRTVFQEHLRFAKLFAEPFSSFISPHTNGCLPDRRLRIGYVSPDFRRHSVKYFLEPVLSSHNHERFEVFCYSDVLIPDNVTERLRGYADQWRNIAGVPDQQVAELVQKDEIDILIDLAGHTGYNRMLVFARKPAPVQVSWLGYANTTGLSTIDYRIVDKHTDPTGLTDQYYTEKLIRMPQCFVCYMPDKDSPDAGDLPALKSGYITFGSLNIFAKISSEVIGLWCKILKAVPDSHLLVKTRSLTDQSTREYALRMFTQRGIGPERIRLMSYEPSYRGHLDIYNHIDIGLDPFPYNGTTTTCEALWMGVPVVTLAGNTHASRVGASLLSNVGLSDLIADTQDKYLQITLNLAGDLKKLQELRRNLREMMMRSPLTDAEGFTRYLEDCYRSIWGKWCGK